MRMIKAMTSLLTIAVRSLCRIGIAASFGLSVSARAENGLPPTAAAYRGAYETNDPGTISGCNNPNALTGTCSCTGNSPPAFSFRVVSDAAGAGGLWGSSATFCSAGLPAPGSEFAGGYQIDDPVPGGQGCKVLNANTGGCSCPAGSTAVPIRALTDGPAGIIGSVVVICYRQTPSPSAFGGAFQIDDPVPGGMGCRSSNPSTGGCSCPAGFVAQPQRLIADNPVGNIFGSHLYTCVPPLPGVQICPGGPLSDPSGNADSAGALQYCIDRVREGGEVSIPAGTYRVDSQLVIPRSMTIRTQGTTGSTVRCLAGTDCAAIAAGPHFYAQNGMVFASRVTSFAMDHIILDGNRSGRITSSAAHVCRSGGNRYGFNAALYRCTNCRFTYSASINALCGTGLEWFGDGAYIQNSLFMHNGDQGIWADGLTLLLSDRATVSDNVFRENTDIGFIFGGGNNSIVSHNSVENRSVFAFAGMMMDNFGRAAIEDRPAGLFYGTTFTGNYIDCQRCSFGMNVGPLPWYPAPRLGGGTVAYNVIRGGHISLNVDGSGADPSSGVTVFGNALGPNIDQGIGCMPSAVFNLSPESFLNPASTQQPDSFARTFRCHR